MTSLAIAFVFGRHLLGIYGAAYSDAYPVFLVVMAAAAVAYGLSVLNFSLNAIGAYKIQVPLFVTVALIMATLCWFLVPVYGILGGAIAVLISNGIQAVMSAIVLISFTRTPSRQSQCTAH